MKNKLCVKSLALALGITWGASLILLGWMSAFGWGLEAEDVMSTLYIGYDATFWGAIIGGLWGFVDGIIGGMVIGFLYNYFLEKGQKKAKKNVAKEPEAKKTNPKKSVKPKK